MLCSCYVVYRWLIVRNGSTCYTTTDAFFASIEDFHARCGRYINARAVQPLLDTAKVRAA
jgi:hypothetical protein